MVKQLVVQMYFARQATKEEKLMQHKHNVYLMRRYMVIAMVTMVVATISYITKHMVVQYLSKESGLYAWAWLMYMASVMGCVFSSVMCVVTYKEVHS